MRVLELFSGTASISKAFQSRGHQTFCVDWQEDFRPDLVADIETLTAQDIIGSFGVPDVVWAAPDCATYSLAAISHHRAKEAGGGENLNPVSDYAKKCDRTVKNVLKIIRELQKENPDLIWFIENPRAGLQKMIFMQPIQKYKRTITFCKYQKTLPIKRRRMKPTNIWTNHPAPKFEPPCNYGDNCHASAPRGSKNGTEGLRNSRERAEYPAALALHIVQICEEIKK